MATADTLPEALKRLRLFGLLARIEEIRNKRLEEVLAIELEEQTRRSLAHRQHPAGIRPFKPVSSFDWNWPRKIDTERSSTSSSRWLSSPKARTSSSSVRTAWERRCSSATSPLRRRRVG